MLRRYAKQALQHVRTNNYQPLNRIELDRQRMLANVALIQKQHNTAQVIPVLKGNAYGHGIVEVARILNDSQCQYLAVDGYFEAAKIRDVTTKHLLVMGYILPENVSLLDTKRCSFVVQDEAGLHAFGALKKPVRIHLELNTGMNRLGLGQTELQNFLTVLKHYPKLELEGVMSHLADADNAESGAFTEKQVAAFDRRVEHILAAGFAPKLIHLAQTAGSAKIHSHYANAFRIGIGTYGVNPLQKIDPHFADLASLESVLELKSTVVKIIELSTGDKVSYNGIFTAPHAMRIAVLPLGYYEGVPRELSNKGCVTYKGKQLPIVGRVCMDHIMVDLQENDLRVTDEVTVISKDSNQPNSIIGWQNIYGLFAYDSLVGLSSSIRRQII